MFKIFLYLQIKLILLFVKSIDFIFGINLNIFSLILLILLFDKFINDKLLYIISLSIFKFSLDILLFFIDNIFILFIFGFNPCRIKLKFSLIRLMLSKYNSFILLKLKRFDQNNILHLFIFNLFIFLIYFKL